jgi:hypothetical protein
MYYEQKKAMEPVEVIAHFHNLEINIIKFKWNNKVYKVDQITNKWKIPDGIGVRTHFIVICKESEIICELSFNPADMKWEIIQYDALN